MPENRNAVFQVTTRFDMCLCCVHQRNRASLSRCLRQVASNFNGVEAISESIPPDRSSFTENYIYDHTQGPAASISAGPGMLPSIPKPDLLSTTDWPLKARSHVSTRLSTILINHKAIGIRHHLARYAMRPRQQAGVEDFDPLLSSSFSSSHWMMVDRRSTSWRTLTNTSLSQMDMLCSTAKSLHSQTSEVTHMQNFLTRSR